MMKKLMALFMLLALGGGALLGVEPGRAEQPAAAAASEVTAYDLIIAMNAVRVSYGNPPLIEDPIVNAVAQATANTMAANLLTWHIGDVRGRLAGAGYGGGATVWGTENFAVGMSLTLDQIMVVWADEAHMLPAVKPYYCHVGAGVAKASNGMVYYVLQAAYVSGKACGSSVSPGATAAPGTTPVSGGWVGPQLIMPVKLATPDAEGIVYHTVEMGQSLWSIAIAYQVTIKDIETWNNISRNTPLRTGQKLLIPGKTTAGYATPTPQGMIVPSTPDADGRIVHTVQAYQTLSTIAAAYDVTVDVILALNGWKVDWPLQIGQQLIVHGGNITPTATPRPLTPIEKLTPAADGNYYHLVKSGETLSWIADLYKVPLADLMAWNGLNLSSVLSVNQQLLLKVTPPATITPTPMPATDTPTPTPVTPTVTATERPTATRAEPTATMVPEPQGGETSPFYLLGGVAAAIGALLFVSLRRRKPVMTESDGPADEESP